MGLPLALKAHNDGDLLLASEHYKRALSQNDNNPVIYQNYGSLLATTGEYDDAEKIYLKGLTLHPNNIPILTNYANLLRKNRPVSALEKYDSVITLHLNNGESIDSDTIKPLFVDIVALVCKLDIPQLSLLIISKILCFHPQNPNILAQLMLLLESEKISSSYSSLLKQLKAQLEDYLDIVDLFPRLEILIALATYECQQFNSLSASSYYDRASKCTQQILSSTSDPEICEKALNLLTVNSWNIACTILRFQQFEKGWSLFEYGLQTPCKGQQRWQRALAKPFSSSELSMWRGEGLTDKSILLLEEQAIGDVMQFASLLDTLIKEAKSVSLFLCDRLLDIYFRSYSLEISTKKLFLYSKNDYDAGALSSSLFDYQSPLGSICQYRFTSLSSYSPKVPCLIADTLYSSNISKKYRGENTHIKLIGVSWRGGGKGDRIRQKSIDLTDFFDLLSSVTNVRFVNLQYGNYNKQIESWRAQGLDIINDSSINPLKNMDNWLAQVAACDAVLSVANTTIHGAGGLNIPTLCLLSRYADWRWLENNSVTRSYWYPSVGIARESSDYGWTPAFEYATKWMSEGCPYPQGPSYQHL